MALRLPTLAQVNARPHATPKHQVPTKLDRAVAKKRATSADDRALAAWARKVKERDEWTDQKTGERLKHGGKLDPLRAEAHHIVSRDDKAVRYDPRNGICLSYATHDAVERNKLRIIGTKFFVKRGKRYIDGRHPVVFKDVA